MQMYGLDYLKEQWGEVLDFEGNGLSKIQGEHKRYVTATVLENTARELGVKSRVEGKSNLLAESVPTNSTGNDIDNFDPVMISLVRRSMPNLIAYDIMGVQPMTGPTGLIFALRGRYSNQTNTATEMFYNEADTGFARENFTPASTLGNRHVGTVPGNTSQTTSLAVSNVYNYATGMTTATGEGLGSNSTLVFPEVAFSIEKVTVLVQEKALKGEYSTEMAQDLKAVHGLDAETELSALITGELLAEINRQMVRTINVTAMRGCSEGTTTAGVFDMDTDSNGRWLVEKFKGLMFQLEREANKIAKATRRGRGNVIICSSDVASALQMAGVLDYTPALSSNGLSVDDTGVTFAGMLNGKYRVYIDPYVMGGDYLTMGFKGSNPMDAGIFYCPYVPIQQFRAVNPDTFQPKIAYKTRYGVVANPFAKVTESGGVFSPAAGLGALEADGNCYYRRSIIVNIM